MKYGFIGLGIMGNPMAKNLMKAGFRLSLHKKDLNNVLETAASTGTRMPLTEIVSSFIDKLVDNGDSDLDHSGLYKFYETLNDSI